MNTQGTPVEGADIPKKRFIPDGEFAYLKNHGKRSRVQRFRVQGSTAKIEEIGDFESNTGFIRSVRFAEQAYVEINRKNMKKNLKPLTLNL
jgi:hypothetical protein